MSKVQLIIGIKTGADTGLYEDDPEQFEIEWHIINPTGTDYLTACALDGQDSLVGQYGAVQPKHGQKITCAQCYALWGGFRKLNLRESNFSSEIK